MSEISIQRMTTDDPALPVFEEAERMIQRLRQHAFDLFIERGAGAGRALDDWLLAERALGWPTSECTERKDEFEFNVALPGFEPADISVTATPRELVVQAKLRREQKSEPRKIEKADKAEKAETAEPTAYWSEFRSADVCRRYSLGADIDVEKVGATLKNGVLRIQARKAAKLSKPVAVAAAA